MSNAHADRAEHLAWCKQRALAYLDAGESPMLAWQSLASDLSKHTATRGHPALELGALMVAEGELDVPDAMRRFINGIN